MNTQKLSAVLERLGALLRNDARQRGLPYGLLPVQVEALLYLARCNRYSDTPQAVTEFLGSTKGTVSQTLKVLERDGLVAKRTDPADRRVVRLRLTTQGQELATELSVPPLLEDALLVDRPRAERLRKDLNDLLIAMQLGGGHRTFGACNTCRFFLSKDDGFRCGLTKEPLSPADTRLICREHETP